MTNFNFKEHLIECMESTDYCAIATVDDNGVWNNPVYFVWDDNFNFYFLSKQETRHMKNIEKNGRVAISIYDTNQKGDFVKGIQLEGIAHIIDSEDKNDEFFLAYKTYYKRTGEFKEDEAIAMNSEWEFVKIVPEKIYYFNNEIYGEERQEVPMDSLKP